MPMNISKKAALPAVAIAAAAVAALQLFMYDSEIIIAQATLGSIPVELIAEILITVTLHAFFVLVIPLILIARQNITAGYAALALSLAAYVQLTTDLSLIGMAVTAIAFSILAVWAISKAFEWVRYLRAR
ncbi:hypothetical protein [Pseudomonas iridis]|uniref:hypothetical protein n=1 Tax=Pseudomonas iridis TaxID=2710587 RepID=UPI0021C01153|nr:hypothetical protein [Pseudomonas iridis]MCT8950688.1 hypothetical protein [Pseudomonas iridis]